MASPFDGAGTDDVHVATEVLITSYEGMSHTLSGPGLTNIPVPGGTLDYSTWYTWQVRYLGTNNPAWSDYSRPTSFVTEQGPPRLLAYDGAAYGIRTNGIGTGPGAGEGGSGWHGAWEGMWYNFGPSDYAQTRVNVGSPGLQYVDMAANELVAVSNRFMTSSEADYQGTPFVIPGTRTRRTLGRDGAMHLVNTNGYFGVDNTTNWISFVARYEYGDSNSMFGVELADLGTATKQSSKFVIGKPNGVDAWGLWASNGSSAVSSVPVLNGTAAFLVAELVFQEGNDEMRLYVNPEFGDNPPAMADATLSGAIDLQYARIGVMASAGTAAPCAGIDEIRLGEDWVSVTPYVPEPFGGIAALALAIASVARVRGRRSHTTLVRR
jgi:hypothetical protein